MAMKKSCKRLNAMLSDEKKAPRDYAKLKKVLPANERPKITRIQKQERQHYQTLTKIKARLKKK